MADTCSECGGKYYSKGLCRPHYEKQLRQQNPQFAERQRQNNLVWKSENVQKVKEYGKRRKQDPIKRRASTLKCNYGITLDQYDDMLQAQQGVCFLCGDTNGSRPLFVDHCHDTGVVRKLLCHRCNLIVGFIETRKDKLEDYLAYVRGDFDAISRQEG